MNPAAGDCNNAPTSSSTMIPAAGGGGNKAPDSSSTAANSNASESGAGKKMQQAFDKSLGTVASLSKLLPTGTTLAFQTMAPSFTKGGDCHNHDVNFAFTWGLIGFLTLLCAVLSFTDSVTDKYGRTFYGIATPKGFVLFNHDLKRLDLAENTRHLRRRMRMNPLDWLHAAVSAAVFVAIAFCDAGVQRCLVPTESQPWKDFLNHLPLAVGFLASFLLIVYPSTRKGIGEDDGLPAPDHSDDDAPRSRLFDKSLGTVAGLTKLLPTGTTLAFQTLAPSFAKGGQCRYHGVNFAFTWGLIGFLTLLCAALSFTDSITDRHGNTYYGIAIHKGFKLFDHHPREGDEEWRKLKEQRRIKKRDWLHALLSAAVFVAIAFCDAGVQGCLVPKESRQWREFLALLPLAVGLVASFVFIIFPSTRKGIGQEGAPTPTPTPTPTPDEDTTATKKEEGNTTSTVTATTTTTSSTTTTTKTWKSSAQAMGANQVAPSSSACDEQLDTTVP